MRLEDKYLCTNIHRCSDGALDGLVKQLVKAVRLDATVEENVCRAIELRGPIGGILQLCRIIRCRPEQKVTTDNSAVSDAWAQGKG